MDFEFSNEQRMWHDVVHDFMEKEVGRKYTREHDQNREFPEEIYRKMADLGWLGLLIPESDGGQDADPVMFAIFCDRQVQSRYRGVHYDLHVYGD
jgi:alkylation response protein AidB-like acyl-CoA dehydrogenase